jgi:cytoskeletal protein RodZ
VTVGETLTEARCQAGLSVDELSERTRIRQTVIRSIEQDDYEACGGDLYVRGYVRAIAGAVGIDAQPLIREYDLGRADGPPERANGSTGRHAKGFPTVPLPLPGAAPTSFDLPAVTEPAAGHDGSADLGATRFDLPAVSADPATTSFDLPRVPEAPRAPADLMAAGYDLGPTEPERADSATAIMPALGFEAPGPPEPAGPPAPMMTGAAPTGTGAAGIGPAETAPPETGATGTGPTGRVRGKRRGLFIGGAAAVVVLVAAGALGVNLASGSTTVKDTAATAVPQSAALSAAAKASAAAKTSASAAAKASASASASASAAAKASQVAAAKAGAQRVTTLTVASATAYGPDGFGDGDNPGNATYAIAPNASQSWATQWYSTPNFGMLKHGTGLLLDLGGKVTVVGLRLDLARYRGSDLQIRVGNGTATQDLRVVATADNVAGAVNLTLRHPVAARYLLIWFTQLPPDGSGHYQASASRVVVTGRR